MCNRINSMQKILANKFKDKNGKIEEDNLPYMNINKRGGLHQCNDKILDQYFNDYKDYIKDEIININPKIIVCCGRYSYIKQIEKEIKEKELKENAKNKSTNNKFIIINMIHPSSRISNEKYGKIFEERLEEAVNKINIKE